VYRVLVIGHKDEENRFCRACGPVYTGAQLAQAAREYLRRVLGAPVEVTYVDAADPEIFAQYMARIREARREGLRFPLVYVNDTLVLHGSAEPYAIARKIQEMAKMA